jgi:hypothetical protein
MSDNLHNSPSHGNGWREWSNYVLTALEKTDGRIEAIDARLRTVESEIQVLKSNEKERKRVIGLYVSLISAGIIVIFEIGRIIIAHASN